MASDKPSAASRSQQGKSMFRILLCATLLLITQSALAFSYTLEISEKELQQRAEAMMPLERSQYFITVRLSNPKLELLPNNNRIGISSNISANIPGGFKGKGHATITGSLRYDSQRGAFYLDKPVIEKLHIDKLPKQYLPQIKGIAQKALSKSLTSKPLYQLNDKDLRQKLAKSMLKKISIKNKILFVELSAF